MGKKVMTEVEKSIHEESEKISEARKAIKARKQIIDNSDMVNQKQKNSLRRSLARKKKKKTRQFVKLEMGRVSIVSSY